MMPRVFPVKTEERRHFQSRRLKGGSADIPNLGDRAIRLGNLGLNVLKGEAIIRITRLEIYTSVRKRLKQGSLRVVARDGIEPPTGLLSGSYPTTPGNVFGLCRPMWGGGRRSALCLATIGGLLAQSP